METASTMENWDLSVGKTFKVILAVNGSFCNWQNYTAFLLRLSCSNKCMSQGVINETCINKTIRKILTEKKPSE